MRNVNALSPNDQESIGKKFRVFQILAILGLIGLACNASSLFGANEALNEQDAAVNVIASVGVTAPNMELRIFGVNTSVNNSAGEPAELTFIVNKDHEVKATFPEGKTLNAALSTDNNLITEQERVVKTFQVFWRDNECRFLGERDDNDKVEDLMYLCAP